MNGTRTIALRILWMGASAVCAAQVDEVWKRIETNEPGLVAAALARDEAEGGARAMGAWMAPEARVEQMWMTTGMPDATTLSVSQAIPLGGQPGLRRRAEGQRAAMGGWTALDSVKSREMAFRSAWWELWGMRSQQVVLRERMELLARASEVAGAQRVSGMVGAEALVRLQTTRSRARLDSLDLASRTAAMEAMLLSWLGAPMDSSIGPIDGPSAPAVDLGGTDSLARTQPSVEGMRSEAAMSALEAKAEARGLWPDLMVGGSWKISQTEDPGGFGVMAGITLPFVPWAGGMAEGKVHQARIRERRATFQALAMERMEVARLRALEARIASLRGRLAVLDSAVVPQAKTGQDLSLGALSAGTGSVGMVLETSDMVAMARMEQVMAVAALAQAESEWRVAQEMAGRR